MTRKAITLAGGEYRLEDHQDGTFTVTHLPSGNEETFEDGDLVLDRLTQDLDAQGYDISNVGAFSAGELDHGQVVLEKPDGSWENYGGDLISACQAAPDLSNIYVYGDVTIDEPIVYKDSWSHWSLIGLGDRTSSIKASSSFTGDTMMDFSGSNVINRWGRIENIQFDGQNNVSTGIQMHQAQGGLLRDVHVDFVTGIGIDLDNNAYDNNLWRVEVDGTGGIGINIGDANETTLFNCLIRDTGSHGIQMGQTGPNLVGARIIGSRIRSVGAANDGIRIENNYRCYNNLILGCHFEAGMDIGINYSPSNQGSQGGAWVANCRFNGQETAGIRTRNKADLWVVGPANDFDVIPGIDLGHDGYSQPGSVSMFNRLVEPDQLDTSSVSDNADLTVIEPSILRFEMPGDSVFEDTLRIERADLSTITGNLDELRAHNGNDGNSVGYYEWDGSNWVGIGRAAGTTISPS